ncbi:HSFY1 protein, partial [Alectura lathami]|nr:HSFY1 protein [Alectura lathami]
TSNVSVLNMDLAVSASPVPQVRGERVARDAASGTIKEENSSQGSREVPCAKRVHLSLPEESSGKANDFSSYSFLKKLWEIVGSDQFQSIWWGDDGNSIVIAAKFFQKDVLARRGPLRIFEIDSMKTFIRQLHLHGFFIMEGHLTTSAPRDKFLGDEAEVSAFTDVLHYYNRYFKKDYPHLLRRGKQRVGAKRRAPAALSPGPDLKEGCQRRSPLKTQ